MGRFVLTILMLAAIVYFALVRFFPNSPVTQAAETRVHRFLDFAKSKSSPLIEKVKRGDTFIEKQRAEKQNKIDNLMN